MDKNLLTIDDGYLVRCQDFPDGLTKKEALELSIEKWQRIVDHGGGIGNGGISTCALCHLFIPSDCKGCPVMEATGEAMCNDTPYVEYENMSSPHYRSVEKAQEEVDFLKSLRS